MATSKAELHARLRAELAARQAASGLRVVGVVKGAAGVTKSGTTLEEARRKFGRPFAHEPGSDWKPSPEPFLTRWLRGQGKVAL